MGKGIKDKTRLEEAFRQLNEKSKVFQQAFINSPAVRLRLHSDTGKILDANNAAVKFYGYSREILLAMSIYELTLGDATPMSEYAKAAEETTVTQKAFKHLTSNNGIRDVEVHSGIIDIFGEKLLDCFVVDITEKIGSEKSLMESQERLSIVVEGAKAGIWDWDLVTNQVFFDRQWKAILGYEEHEITGGFEEWQNRWHPEDEERIRKVMQDYSAGRCGKYEIEHRLRHKNGTYRWILTTGKILLDDCKKPVRWVGSNIDVTVHREYEALRLESEKRLRDFSRAMPDTSFIFDEDGRYIEIYGQNEGLLLDSKEKLKGLHLHQILPKEKADLYLSEIKYTISSGMPRTLIKEMGSGKNSRIIQSRSAPMNYTVNSKKTVAVVMTDITERVRQERNLRLLHELEQKSIFFNNVISANATLSDQAVLEAKMLGVDVLLPVVCCLMDVEKGLNSNEEALNNSFDLKMTRTKLMEQIAEEKNLVVWDNQKYIGIFFNIENEENISVASIQIAERIRKKNYTCEPELPILFAFSEPNSGLDSLAKGFNQAESTIWAAKCTNAQGEGVHCYRNIGIYQLLTTYGEQAAREYIYKTIGSLIIYDQQKGSNLVETLEVILTSTNLKEAAARLYFHPKTVVFRKQRIESILGVCIDQMETKIALAIAIKVYRLTQIRD